jgi:formate hydrogenlyase subunit 6/NADH:ubiquinone oxidoreductase subunit I
VFSGKAPYPEPVPLDRKWFHAKVHLGTRVVLHFLRKAWPWSPRFGLSRFQQNYVVEELPPFTPAHRARGHEAGRCTGCGVCDDVCPIVAGCAPIPADTFMGPHAFVVAGARSSPHLADIAVALDTLTGSFCTTCRACDRACPEAIPVTAVAALLQGQRKAIETARHGTMPVQKADVPALAAAAREQSAGAEATTTRATAVRSKTEEH